MSKPIQSMPPMRRLRLANTRSARGMVSAVGGCSWMPGRGRRSWARPSSPNAGGSGRSWRFTRVRLSWASRMALPLAILTTGLPVPRALERRGFFSEMIKASLLGVLPEQVDDYDATTTLALPEPDEVAGIIVTGSPARVGTREPWILRIEDQLRRYTDAGTPVFGICFGHQLLGNALGGKAEPNPNGREIGTPLLDHLVPDELMNDIPDDP